MNEGKKILWQPLPGSQALAVGCPCDQILYHGTRGPGKTEAQIAYFAGRCGLGYGRFWRGIIFDRGYKNLDDLIAKSLALIPKIFPKAKFLSSKSDLCWKFPDGEMLLFRHMKTAKEYRQYHGHEYCLEENQTIQTPRGPVAIKDLQPGDEVLTPSGPKKVTKKFNVGLKRCVSVSTYTSDGTQHFLQLQSEDHHLLTTAQGWKKAPSERKQSVLQFPEMSHLEATCGKSLSGGHQGIPDSYAQPAHAGSASTLFGKQRQNALPTLPLASSQGKPSTLLRKAKQHSPGSPTEPHASSEFCEPSPKHTANQTKQSLGSGQHQELGELVHCLCVLFPNGQDEDALVESQTTQDFQSDCFSGPRPCGGLARMGKENAQPLVQQQYDVAKPTLDKPMGVVEPSILNTHPCVFEFPHPYQSGRQIRTNLEASELEVEFHFEGVFPCYDIEVEDVNCYFTTSGLVNKNCFIGWNELTNYPTSELYDLMGSCKRSSFVPEEHSPDLTPEDRRILKECNLLEEPIPQKVKNRILPPIPLVTFSTTNPHGPGHGWVKKRWVDKAGPGRVIKTAQRVFNPRTEQDEEINTSQVHIFGSYKENKYLDAKYVAFLNSIKDPNKRRAWLGGDWSITSGGALDDLWRASNHVLPRFILPKSWRLQRSFDWGSSHPFSVGFWAIANGEEVTLPNGKRFAPARGSIIRFSEIYGCELARNDLGQLEPAYETNRGLRLSAREVARRINEHVEELTEDGWIERSVEPGPADGQIFNVNEKESDSIAALMLKEGVEWYAADKSAGTRKNGLEMFRVALENAIQGEGPGVFVMENCEAFIQTVPSLPRDEDDPDDVDTTAVDHIYDDSRYMILDNKPQFAGTVKIGQAR